MVGVWEPMCQCRVGPTECHNSGIDRNPGLFRGFRRPRNFDIGPFGQVTDLECKKISVQVTPAYLNIAELGKIRRIFPIRLRYPLWSQAAPLAQQP